MKDWGKVRQRETSYHWASFRFSPHMRIRTLCPTSMSHPLLDKTMVEARGTKERSAQLFKAYSKAIITVKFYCTMKSLDQILNQMGNQGNTHKLVLFWAHDHTIESFQNYLGLLFLVQGERVMTCR